MSLSRKIVAAVEAATQAGAVPGTVHADDVPHHLEVRLAATGPVGLAFESLSFSVDGPGPWPPEALSAWGDRLAARLSYLMEPLTVLEADTTHGVVVMRSQSPTPRQGQRSYYEIRLDGYGSLQLGRFAFDEGTRRRQPIPCQLTTEAFERLTEDLVASVG